MLCVVFKQHIWLALSIYAHKWYKVKQPFILCLKYKIHLRAV